MLKEINYDLKKCRVLSFDVEYGQHRGTSLIQLLTLARDYVVNVSKLQRNC